MNPQEKARAIHARAEIEGRLLTDSELSDLEKLEREEDARHTIPPRIMDRMTDEQLLAESRRLLRQSQMQATRLSTDEHRMRVGPPAGGATTRAGVWAWMMSQLKPETRAFFAKRSLGSCAAALRAAHDETGDRDTAALIGLSGSKRATAAWDRFKNLQPPR
jgi:hypothetical protein